MKYYLAIDIGASSGRHIIGWRENGEVKTEEVYRFPCGEYPHGGQPALHILRHVVPAGSENFDAQNRHCQSGGRF